MPIGLTPCPACKSVNLQKVMPSQLLEDMYKCTSCGWDSRDVERVADTDSMLRTRGKAYGNFSTNALIAQELKYHIHKHKNYTEMPADMREALDMIAVKISRMLNGDFNHKDNWDDIAGYAQLVAERMAKDDTQWR